LACQLAYIPKHLHAGDRQPENIFQVGEELYYRTNPDNLQRPYDNIKLQDISHNRSVLPKQGDKEDVLYNIIIDDEQERYENKTIVALLIKNLGELDTYSKTFTTKYDDALSVTITLLHDPVPCMYPHSVFELRLVDGTVVDSHNYTKTLGKRNQAYSDLREQIRNELTAMMLNEEIDSTQSFEEVVL